MFAIGINSRKTSQDKLTELVHGPLFGSATKGICNLPPPSSTVHGHHEQFLIPIRTSKRSSLKINQNRLPAKRKADKKASQENDIVCKKNIKPSNEMICHFRTASQAASDQKHQ